MQRLCLVFKVCGTLSVLSVGAQAVEVKGRVVCDPADPAKGCDAWICKCTPDSFAVTFDGGGGSVLEVEGPAAGRTFETTIVLDVSTPGIEGCSFGIAHDPDVLTIEKVTVEGTDAEEALFDGFVVADRVDIDECVIPERTACLESRPGDGYIFAFLTHLTNLAPKPLSLGRHTLCKATYSLLRDPGPEGTLIRFTESLEKRGSPPVSLNITVGATSTRPEHVVDGWVKGNGCGAEARFTRGDVGVLKAGKLKPADGVLNISDAIQILGYLFLGDSDALACEKAADANDDGKVQLADAVYLLQYLFTGGPAPAAPFPDAGSDPTADGLGCCGAR